MKGSYSSDHPLRKEFRIATNLCFDLGVESVPPADKQDVAFYFSEELLPRFTHMRELQKGWGYMRNADSTQDIEQHACVGDLCLFMNGFFPEHLSRIQRRLSKPLLLQVGSIFVPYENLYDYMQQRGKSSYAVASEKSSGLDAEVFKALSENFEICANVMGLIEGYLRHLPDYYKGFQKELEEIFGG